MWCKVSMGQTEDSGEHPCAVCRKGVGVRTQSYARSVLGGFTRDVVVLQES